VRLEALSHWAARGTDMILTDVVKSSMEPGHQKTNQPYASVMFVHAGPHFPHCGGIRWDRALDSDRPFAVSWRFCRGTERRVARF
jgi:hypothetical protein